MNYELVWHYADDPAHGIESEPYIHFWFMLRFPDLPPGKGHTANFVFNVLQRPESTRQGISVLRRGFLDAVPFSKSKVQEFVEASVAFAATKSRDEALAILNEQFIYDDLDFSNEFADDLLEADKLLALIHDAFDGVDRQGGITLHQALVIDDYGTQEELEAAEAYDTEDRWQNVPESDISKNISIFNFLDPIGFRYYLPAYMSWSIKNYTDDESDCSFFTFMAVLPTVAPRDVGLGIGNAFDLDNFINERGFTSAQIDAIYRFICFMAIKAEFGMSEDYYAATKKWRIAAEN
ncbi:MAG: hypothetical protein JNL64_09765 [Blastocatellia bacterium]|nr:hypothetical protein [Blastocatellia bacterium]